MAEIRARTAAVEWRAHWPTVFSGMLGMSFFAMITYHFGLFIQPLEREFGWSRASISLGLTIFTGTAVVIGPFVGALIDKIGSRWIGIFGLTTTSCTIAALSQANGSINQWYMLWSFIALTALFARSTVWGTATSSVFNVSRSLALSVMLSGTAIAQFASPLLGAALISNLGWRTAYLWFGLGWGGIALIVVVFMFFDARDHRRRAAASDAPPPQLGGLTIQEALHSPQIIRIALANLLMTTLGGGIAVHLVPILSSYNLNRADAAGMAALAGITGVAGKLVTGWLLDRYQGSLIPFSSFAFQGLGYFFLLNTFDARTALVVAVLLLGYASGAGLQVTTYLTSRYSGMRNFGKIYATIASMMMLGTSIGPWIAGAVYDQTKSYELLLMVAVPVMLIGALMFVRLGPYPEFTTVGRSESKLP